MHAEAGATLFKKNLSHPFLRRFSKTCHFIDKQREILKETFIICNQVYKHVRVSDDLFRKLALDL
jgi:hypothetical protein